VVWQGPSSTQHLFTILSSALLSQHQPAPWALSLSDLLKFSSLVSTAQRLIQPLNPNCMMSLCETSPCPHFLWILIEYLWDRISHPQTWGITRDMFSISWLPIIVIYIMVLNVPIKSYRPPPSLSIQGIRNSMHYDSSKNDNNKTLQIETWSFLSDKVVREWHPIVNLKESISKWCSYSSQLFVETNKRSIEICRPCLHLVLTSCLWSSSQLRQISFYTCISNACPVNNYERASRGVQKKFA